MERDKSSRRGFMAKLSKVAAAIGALSVGVIPELRAQAATMPINPAASPVADAPSLPPDQENQLYSAALGDTDVSLLLSTLPEPARLDPPVRSFNMSADSGYPGQAVMLPATSYASGAAIAYVYYGSASVPVSDGPSPILLIRAMVTNSGAVMLAGGGQMVPSPNRDWSEGFFAALFPEQYYFARINTDTPAVLRPTSGTDWNPAFLRKAMYAGGGARGACFRACARGFAQCMITATAALGTAIIAGIICVICVSAATGGIAATAGVSVSALSSCFVGCGIAGAAVVTILTSTTICAAVAQSCNSECKLIPLDQGI
jgi:hypothetical protein